MIKIYATVNKVGNLRANQETRRGSLARVELERNSQTLPPVRGCVGLWRRG